MPVRNGGAFLPAAVESILAQSFRDFEFLVVDDGSSDGTGKRLAEYQRADPRIRLLASPGRGIVAALNLGIAEARGALIARMDADDIAFPGRLAVQAAFLEAQPRVGAVGTAAEKIDATGRRGGIIRMPTTDGEIREQLSRRSPIIHPSAMIRKSELAAAGLYRGCCIFAEDYDLWLRLAARTRLANLSEACLSLRSHPGQISAVRRLPQRASAALARRLASDAPPEIVDGAGEEPLWRTLGGYVRDLPARSPHLTPSECTDAEVILLALRSQGDLTRFRAMRAAASLPTGRGKRALSISKLLLTL